MARWAYGRREGSDAADCRLACIRVHCATRLSSAGGLNDPAYDSSSTDCTTCCMTHPPSRLTDNRTYTSLPSSLPPLTSLSPRAI
jgi:hypothetical protein